MKHFKLITFSLFIFFTNCEGPLFDVPDDKDTIPPTLTITYPADQSVLSDTVLITAYAFDNVELDTVQIYLNDSIIHSSKEGPFEYQWITNNFGEDISHTIRAKAIDLQGNVNFTNTISVIVDNFDNSPPEGAIIFPFTGQTLSGEITVIIEATDNEEVSSVILYLDGNEVQTFTEPPYRYSWNTIGQIDDIIYTIHAHVLDNNSNQITLGPINITIDNEEPTDNISPTGTITSPSSGSSVSGSIDISINAIDNIEVDFVDIIIDGSLVYTDSTVPYYYDWNTLNEIEDAQHIINVNIYDISGNSTTLFPVSVFVNNTIDPDNTPPSIVITEPASNQTLSGVVTIKTFVTDNLGIDKVEFYHNYVLVHTQNESPYNYDWNTLTYDDETQHTWYAKAYDTSENIDQTQPISVNIDNDDNIPPTGYISYPFAGQNVEGEIQIQLSTNDNNSVEEAYFYINGSLVFTDNEAPFTYIWDTLLEEENRECVLFASISDIGGNQTDLNPIVVMINNDDTIENDQIPPFASIITPLSSQSVSDTVIITGFATDNVLVQEVEYFIDGVLFETLIDTPYSIKWNTYIYPNNSNHSITMVARDPTGNEFISQPVYVEVQNEFSGIASNINLSRAIGSISLSWDAPFNAETYKIYRDGSFLSEVQEQTFINNTDGGIEHCFQISAVNSFNIEGEKSDSLCGTAILPPPSNFSSILNYDNIVLSWSAITNATEYELKRDNTLLWSGEIFSYTDSDIGFSTTYNYSINGVDFLDSSGALSEIITLNTLPQILPPMLASSLSGTTMTLNWTSIENAESYRVYKNNSFFIEVTGLTLETDISTTEETCFKITAINILGIESSDSNIECGTGS